MREASRQALVAACQNSLSENGTLIACHWKPDFADRLQSTAAIHAAFHAIPNWTRHVHHEEADFLLDAWSACPSSPAPAPAPLEISEGLAF